MIHVGTSGGGGQGVLGFCLLPLSPGHAPHYKMLGGGGVLPYFGHFLCPRRWWMAPYCDLMFVVLSKRLDLVSLRPSIFMFFLMFFFLLNVRHYLVYKMIKWRIKWRTFYKKKNSNAHKGREGGEMKQRLVWNNAKSSRQAHQRISVLCHALLAMGTPLFHAKRCFIWPSFLCTSICLKVCAPRSCCKVCALGCYPMVD